MTTMGGDMGGDTGKQESACFRQQGLWRPPHCCLICCQRPASSVPETEHASERSSVQGEKCLPLGPLPSEPCILLPQVQQVWPQGASAVESGSEGGCSPSNQMLSMRQHEQREGPLLSLRHFEGAILKTQICPNHVIWRQSAKTAAKRALLALTGLSTHSSKQFPSLTLLLAAARTLATLSSFTSSLWI